ncbi:hypothetical protein HYE67_007436 [Fusarium culmorum]|uniref:Clr5 domain-containing protein n=1 Tax=Fusarium culmorum TaxID=5516 RepID=A0A2T4H1G0_FUSCU|nr:hypothetical protein FCULG_00008518 [Fusarium culmorum]QPC65205.1 hypothetical protein HYE67_007436 [Fusarium culmorum]
MSKAPKIPHEQWEAYRDVIKTLYLEQNKTIKEIGKFMSENYQFYATEKQYIRKVTVNWKLRKNTKKEEWEQASALVLKRKVAGKPTELTIHGKIIPDKKRKKETRRYAPKNLEPSLYIEHYSIVLEFNWQQWSAGPGSRYVDVI